MNHHPAAKLQSYSDGGAQWAVPQADLNDLLDGSFAAGPDSFRAAMRHHAKGVAVVTAGVERPVGFCATSLVSVALTPPIVAFTVGLTSSSWPVVEASRHVMVHLLADDQADLARRFGSGDADKFGPGSGTQWHRDAFGLPVLDEALAWLVVALTSHIPVGDHTLVIGRVVATRCARRGDPLIHHGGEFVSLAVSRG